MLSKTHIFLTVFSIILHFNEVCLVTFALKFLFFLVSKRKAYICSMFLNTINYEKTNFNAFIYTVNIYK